MSGGLESVLREHVIVWENDGGDYGGRSWFECSCERDDVISATEYASEDDHRDHLAAAVAAWIVETLAAEEVVEAVARAIGRAYFDGFDTCEDIDEHYAIAALGAVAGVLTKEGR